MPELLDPDRELAPGDVLMVERKMKDQKTGKRWLWRFFLVVDNAALEWSDEAWGYIVGNEKMKDKLYRVDVDDDRNTVHYLPQEEWPDGVHQFRTALILRRKIDL